MVAVLLRFILWRCADFHRAAVHRAADTPLKLKDGYAVRTILPRPERRGLSRTRSKKLIKVPNAYFNQINLRITPSLTAFTYQTNIISYR